MPVRARRRALPPRQADRRRWPERALLPGAATGVIEINRTPHSCRSDERNVGFRLPARQQIP